MTDTTVDHGDLPEVPEASGASSATSTLTSTQEARTVYDEHKATQKLFL